MSSPDKPPPYTALPTRFSSTYPEVPAFKSINTQFAHNVSPSPYHNNPAGMDVPPAKSIPNFAHIPNRSAGRPPQRPQNKSSLCCCDCSDDNDHSGYYRRRQNTTRVDNSSHVWSADGYGEDWNWYHYGHTDNHHVGTHHSVDTDHHCHNDGYDAGGGHHCSDTGGGESGGGGCDSGAGGDSGGDGGCDD